MIKTLNLYSKISVFVFGSSILLWIINDAILKAKIPIEIVGHIFFLSLGLFIGVHSCIDVIKRSTNNK